MDEIESHLLRNQMELADKTVYVQKGTIYASRLATLADEIGDTIHIIEEDKDIEELIAAVATGEIDYTVSDNYLALVNTRYFDNIDAKTPISFPQNIACCRLIIVIVKTDFSPGKQVLRNTVKPGNEETLPDEEFSRQEGYSDRGASS